MVEISREERDVYLIPQNFVDTGTILGGTVKLRNAVEAAVLAVGSAVPLFYLPLAFNIRLMIVIAVSVPLGVFDVEVKMNEEEKEMDVQPGRDRGQKRKHGVQLLL